MSAAKLQFCIVLVTVLLWPAVPARAQTDWGACCLPDGSCNDGFGQDFCENTLGGIFYWETYCFQITCYPFTYQACCFSDGYCTMTEPATCYSMDGTPQGPGSTCDPNPCQQPRACCFPDGSCYEMTPGDCTAAGGAPGTPFSDCDPNPCYQPPPEYACCFYDSSCLDLDPIECQNQGGQVHLEGTCATVTCPDNREACCHLNDPGVCTYEYPGDCMYIPGESQGAPGYDCAFDTCAYLEPWPCCFYPTGECEMLTEEDCIAAGGESHPITFSTCEEAACAPEPPYGACCDNFDGSCSIDTEPNCLARGGYWAGNYPCDQAGCVPREACCRPDGTCIMAAPDLCIEHYLGTPHGPGTTCETVEPCPQVCCLPDATCDMLTPDECLALGGNPEGTGINCADFECPQACCLTDGHCIFEYPPDCAIAGGTPQGTTTCDLVECGFCTEFPQMDFNFDCRVDLADFAEFAKSWLTCNWLPPEDCW